MSTATLKPTGSSPRRRAAFISDVHLGAAHCHAEELAAFLGTLDVERLYLVGDIVDLWWMSAKRAAWGHGQNHVVEALHRLRAAGTELIYVPGNHDRPIRRFCGLMLPRMSVRRRVIHTTADGRRLLVVHGDDYDSATQFGGFQEELGDWLYERILTGNRIANALRRRFGLRYWSLADFLKRQSGAAERYIARFIEAGLDDVRRRGLDGLVYANDGDWVESLTALVEDRDGTLRLLDHRGETLKRLGPKVCWIDERREVPARAAAPEPLHEAA
jgi:UDP-2,3-diacylglucosamine pyrophosphatase LpxH